jgi:ElaB/YqjD/DUF883 family membrane-anchored ribosome-binding protein
MTDTIKQATDTAQDLGNKAAEQVKQVVDPSLLTQAQEKVTDAFNATVEAVKEHPVAAAAIATGAAAAVAGTVYGVKKLREGE